MSNSDDEEHRRSTTKLARIEVPPSRRAPDVELKLADALIASREAETMIPCPLIDTIEPGKDDHLMCDCCNGTRLVTIEQRLAWVQRRKHASNHP